MSAYDDLALSLGPIAHWPLSDPPNSPTANDLGPNNLDGEMQGNYEFGVPSLVTGGGTALRLVSGGSGSGYNAPASAPFDLPGDYSVVFLPKTTVGTPQVVVKMSNNLYFGLEGQPSIAGAKVGPNVADGLPHHVVFVASSGQITVYTDGVASSTTVPKLGPFGDGWPMHVGYFHDYTPAAGFTGDLGPVTIYNKALTPQNIAALAAFVAPSGPPPLQFARNLSDVTWTGVGSCTVTAPTPTGGTGTYTRAWHLLPSFGTSPTSATLVAGQSGATVNLTGLAPRVVRWLLCVVSDGTTTITSYRRPIRPSGLAPLRVGAIGDSTQAIGRAEGVAALDAAAFWLRAAGGDRAVKATNMAVSGSKTTDWLVGSANLTAALAAFAAAGMLPGDPIGIGLGTNDAQQARTADEFAASYAQVVNAIVAAGYKAVLHYPLWREPGPYIEDPTQTFAEEINPLLIAYQAKIDALIDNVHVFAGDRESFYTFGAHPTLYLYRSASLTGGIHPVELGGRAMGAAEGPAIADAIDPPAEEGGDSTDPGESNVRAQVGYQINGVQKTGTLVVGSGSGDVVAQLATIGITQAWAAQLDAKVSTRSTLSGPAGFSQLKINVTNGVGRVVPDLDADPLPLRDQTTNATPTAADALAAAHASAAGPVLRTPLSAVVKYVGGAVMRTFSFVGTSRS